MEAEVPGLVLCTVLTTFAGDLNRGVELYQQGNYGEAEAELRKVVEAEPENGKARFI
jgi:Flp pilus assembly protein TadD